MGECGLERGRGGEESTSSSNQRILRERELLSLREGVSRDYRRREGDWSQPVNCYFGRHFFSFFVCVVASWLSGSRSGRIMTEWDKLVRSQILSFFVSCQHQSSSPVDLPLFRF